VADSILAGRIIAKESLTEGYRKKALKTERLFRGGGGGGGDDFKVKKMLLDFSKEKSITRGELLEIDQKLPEKKKKEKK